MKTVKIQVKDCDLIFVIGKKYSVYTTLQTLFNDTEEEEFISEAERNLINMFRSESQSTIKSQIFYQKNTQQNLEEQQNIKLISLYFLLTDLQITQYNYFKRKIHEQFKKNLIQNQYKLKIFYVPVKNEQDADKYIKKMKKFSQPDFQQTLCQLNKDSDSKTQRELLKNFTVDKFNWKKNEAFEWLKTNNINTFDQFFEYQSFPSYHKKHVQDLISNLNLLEKLHSLE